MEDATANDMGRNTQSDDCRNGNKRAREEWTDESPEAKKLRENLLIEILDSNDEEEKSGDNWNHVAKSTDDLEGFMKSFEEEISQPAPAPEVPAVDHQETGGKVGAGSDELGFLFEASDHDLGLPPTSEEEGEKEKEEIGGLDGVTFGQMWEFEDGKSKFDDEFAWAFDERDTLVGVDDGVDGLFESDLTTSWPSDYSDFFWRPV